MALEFKKLSEVPVLEETNGDEDILIESAGEIRRVASDIFAMNKPETTSDKIKCYYDGDERCLMHCDDNTKVTKEQFLNAFENGDVIYYEFPEETELFGARILGYAYSSGDTSYLLYYCTNMQDPMIDYIYPGF
jgi:hypothetical protein